MYEIPTSTEDPVAFDMGISTLSRINYWLWKCNEANFNNDIDNWFKGLKIIYKETNAFMKDKEIEEHGEKLEQTEESYKEYLKYVNESGNSSWKMLQNCYTNKNPENQGLTLALALSEEFLKSRGAYRVHGGGFAGTIQVYSPNNVLDDYKNNMEKIFGKSSVSILKIRNIGTCTV